MRVLCIVIFKLWKLILKILLYGTSWVLYLAQWAYLVFHVGHLSKDLHAALIIVSILYGRLTYFFHRHGTKCFMGGCC